MRNRIENFMFYISYTNYSSSFLLFLPVAIGYKTHFLTKSDPSVAFKSVPYKKEKNVHLSFPAIHMAKKNGHIKLELGSFILTMGLYKF